MVSTYSVISFPFISLNGIFSAYEEFIAMKVCDLVQKIGSVLLIVIVLLVGGDLFALVAVNALCGLATIFVKLVVLSRKQNLRINWRFRDRSLLREIFGFSIWTTVVSVCTRLIFNLVPSILGMVSDSTAISQYGIASTIDGYYYSFAAAIGNLFLARVTRLLYGKNKSEKALSELAISVGRIQLIVISLIYFGFAAIGREFIILWMGNDYIITYYCILLLSFPDIIEYAQQIPRDAVIASNKIKSQAVAFIVTAAISVPLTYFAASIAGSLGASIAICISCIIRTVSMCVVYVKELHMDIKSFFRGVYPRMLPVYSVTVLFSVWMNKMYVADNWGMLLVKGVAFLIVYTVSVYFFFLQKNERNIIRKSLLRKM